MVHGAWCMVHGAWCMVIVFFALGHYAKGIFRYPICSLHNLLVQILKRSSIKKPLCFHNGFLFVAEAGLEPARALRSRDFKSLVSTISPSGQRRGKGSQPIGILKAKLLFF
jgi:hypothetical protein